MCHLTVTTVLQDDGHVKLEYTNNGELNRHDRL